MRRFVQADKLEPQQHHTVHRRRVIDLMTVLRIGQYRLVFLSDVNADAYNVTGVQMRPSVSKLLLRCISDNEYTPILRYRSFPYASDYMLPILDTPMSCSGWADLFIDSRYRAKLFVAQEKSDAEWVEMMERLRTLFYDELAKKDYHLLGLTQDPVQLQQYLAKKQEILADYYVIRDWQMVL